jgi:uncharacterized membrane protein
MKQKENHMSLIDPGIHTYKRLIIVAVIGIIVGSIVVFLGWGKYALLAGWDATLLVYLLWVWVSVLTLDGKSTKDHAVREDPARAVSDVLLVIASVASLGGVLILVLDASQASGIEKVLDITIGLVSIAFSWFLVHTTFALKYARLYYGNSQKEVEFNEKSLPAYSNFIYLAFTVGMTFQVSDTDIQTKVMRNTILRQAMLSFVFSTVIIATTINTLASLSK